MNAKIITKETCPFCTRAKNLLTIKNIPYEEIVVGKDITRDDFFTLVPDGVKTVPQIWLNEEYVGGFDDLSIRLQ